MKIIPGYNKLFVRVIESEVPKEKEEDGIVRNVKRSPFVQCEVLAYGSYDTEKYSFIIGQTVLVQNIGNEWLTPRGVPVEQSNIKGSEQTYVVEMEDIIGTLLNI